MLNWSPVPQKVVEKQPIYNSHTKCPRCLIGKGFPLMNMVGSSLICTNCKTQYKQEIIGYKDVLVEKFSQFK